MNTLINDSNLQKQCMESKTYKYRIIESKLKNGSIRYRVQWKRKNLIRLILGYTNGLFAYETLSKAEENVAGHIKSDNEKIEKKIISERVIRN